jgi:hypothetical protein
MRLEKHMLDGLDSVDWKSLRHAYGSAEDVPALLRALASGDEEQRKQAIYELSGNIWHQGTVYAATAAAVPFLYELLNAPSVPMKSDIAGLLACIAAGSGYLEVHSVGEYGERVSREILSEQGKTLEDELKREAQETLSVHRAASARLLDLLPYLFDADSWNRMAVAQALGCYPEFSEAALPELRKAAKSETEEAIQSAIADSIQLLESARGEIS